MPRNVPYHEVPGVPGVKVATYSTPTCDTHIDAEQNAEWCPYCALADLLKFCDISSAGETEWEKAVIHARAVLKPKRRRRR